MKFIVGTILFLLLALAASPDRALADWPYHQGNSFGFGFQSTTVQYGYGFGQGYGHWAPPISVQPIFVAPQPVFVAPQPVFVAPQPVFVAPQPIWVAPPAFYHPVPFGGPVFHPYW